MTHRRLPFLARLVNGVRGAVRTGLEAAESVRSGRRGGPTPAERPDPRADGGRTGGSDRTPSADGTVRCESGGGSPAGFAVGESPERYDAVVDPEAGPTSRGEILEYGLSPAQYVRIVVSRRGGRMKQRRFADEYGWSPSTVSRLLSELEERGAIERYRVGREKVVALPDEA